MYKKRQIINSFAHIFFSSSISQPVVSSVSPSVIHPVSQSVCQSVSRSVRQPANPAPCLSLLSSSYSSSKTYLSFYAFSPSSALLHITSSLYTCLHFHTFFFFSRFITLIFYLLLLPSFVVLPKTIRDFIPPFIFLSIFFHCTTMPITLISSVFFLFTFFPYALFLMQSDFSSP